MIPKIIHYCWLSDDVYPEKIKMCMDSWKKHLPNYEFMLWNLDRFDINSSLWVKQAFNAKKYAFAADYLRLYAVYHYGGIYLDSDVEIVKPFDDLLNLPYFLGKENSENVIEAAVFGAEKECFWVGECLNYYKNRKFESIYGWYDMEPLPSIIKKTIIEKFSLKEIREIGEMEDNKTNVYILPVDYFSPKKWDDPSVLNLTKNTYSIHHFAVSWKRNATMKQKILTDILKDKILKRINVLFQNIKSY
jgi:mannosyltransferase OCH1-like enzyme